MTANDVHEIAHKEVHWTCEWKVDYLTFMKRFHETVVFPEFSNKYEKIVN